MFTPSTRSKAAYALLESRARRECQAVAVPLAEGRMGRRVACDEVAAMLRTRTAEALRLGRDAGLGHFTPLGEVASAPGGPLERGEAAKAAAMAQAQVGFLRSWLLGGGPLVKPGGMGVGPRLDMYALSLAAAYQAGLALGLLRAASRGKGIELLQDDACFLWVRSKAPGLQSCRDCVDREARSLKAPYSLTELMALGFPGEGHTRCLTRCRCRIGLVPGTGGDILCARARRPHRPTAFHGVVDPKSLGAAHPLTVGPGHRPPKEQ